MSFGVVGRAGPVMWNVGGGADCPTGTGNFGGEYRANWCRRCVRTSEAIELPFGVVHVCGVRQRNGVFIHGGSRSPVGKG